MVTARTSFKIKVGLIFRFEIIDASKKYGRNFNFATSLILSSKLLQIASICQSQFLQHENGYI